MSGPSVVAIGGGTGLPVVLKAVRSYTDRVTAVVTVADNGGSSGRLRRDLGILPPGDIRNCLVALADESPLAEVFQYRFQSGTGIAGHTIGNLIIAALADLRGGFPEAVDEARKMLEVEGRVLPSTTSDVTLYAVTKAHGKITGQIRIAKTRKPLIKVALEPLEPPAHRETIQAILDADQVVIGPGSLYTSILPNLLVPGVRRAVCETRARRIFVMNVMTQVGETSLLSATDHITALFSHCGKEVVDVVLANVADGQPTGLVPLDAGVHLIRPCTQAIESMGLRVVVSDVIDDAAPSKHAVDKLARELAKLV
ncbi:MAG: uridine diphosphate-N-acetylglucosamine-binding protein YvcK [Actinobacteria bacterium]|nr:uridine diphosphate-N-acetylglucosamine-binding protein YvcK [Actinomycetota bacterium]